MKKYFVSHRIEQPIPTRDHNGFTLIEVMITMAIASFILAAAFTIFANYSRTNRVQNVSANMQQDMRAGLSFIEQEIRNAGLDPLEVSTGVGFTTATATSITFTSDNDFNGLIAIDDPSTTGIDETQTSPDERIIFTYNAGNGTLTRQNLAGTETVLRNISALTFSFFGTGNTPIGAPVPAASLDDIRAVNINLTLSERAGGYGTISRQSQTQVYCRNLNL
jgi:prepilin-type N-terminal cleavage/methylation domain-containing protein